MVARVALLFVVLALAVQLLGASGTHGVCMVLNSNGQVVDASQKPCSDCQQQCLTMSHTQCAVLVFEADTFTRAEVAALRCSDSPVPVGGQAVCVAVSNQGPGVFLETGQRSCQQCLDRCVSLGSDCVQAVWAGVTVGRGQLDSFNCSAPLSILPVSPVPASPSPVPASPSPVPASPSPVPASPLSPPPLAGSSPVLPTVPSPVPSSPGLPNCSAPADSGLCKAAFPAYAYNSTSGMCEFFYYGGCGGNSNRFDTVAACDSACTPEEPTCLGICTLQFAPVCGRILNETFGNDCAAKCAGFSPDMVCEGECPCN